MAPTLVGGGVGVVAPAPGPGEGPGERGLSALGLGVNLVVSTCVPLVCDRELAEAKPKWGWPGHCAEMR